MPARLPPHRLSCDRHTVHHAAWLMALLVFLVPLANAEATAAKTSPGTLLEHMSQALRNLDYQGSLIYEHSGRVDSLRIFHAGGPRERERLVSLNGSRSEVVREGDQVICNLADGTTTLFTQAAGKRLLPLLPETSRRSIKEHYQLALAGTDRVAGYSADIVDVLARDRYRYGYRLWLDRHTRLPLRSVVMDVERRALEQIMFVALEIGVLPHDSDLQSTSHSVPAPVSSPTETELVSAPRWQVGTLPAGFTLVSARRPVGVADGTEHLVYSDGLAGVSIYIEPLGASQSGINASSMRGTLNIYMHTQEAWRITALGNVPALTVEQMARSVISADHQHE